MLSINLAATSSVSAAAKHNQSVSTIKGGAMDEAYLNSSDDGDPTSMFNLSTSSPDETSSSGAPYYTCALYKFLISGVITLIISIIGLVGKSTELSNQVSKQKRF